MLHSYHAAPLLFRGSIVQAPRVFCRHKSLRAAIERGINHAERRSDSRPIRRNTPNRGNTTNRVNPQGREDQRPRQTPSRRYVPESLPYTTSASEFLYGFSVVLAAVKANRRKLYNLYIHSRGWNHEKIQVLTSAAKAAKLKIHKVEDEYLRVLDKASNGRPHNGFILETSPLPRPPLKQLGNTSLVGNHFRVALDAQNREDVAVNGTQTEYSYTSAGWRHPLILYVDGVLDEGNLGAIARSAYFLGVDGIITPTRQSAPWSQIALKASAGAAEAVPIFTVSQPGDFLMRSAREGWRIYASDAVPPDSLNDTTSEGPTVGASSNKLVYTVARSTKRPAKGHCPVESHPTILMMGAEGSGLRASLLNHAHFKVGIPGGRDVDEIGVDSLNVSVAASLLCYEILQKPTVQKSADALF